jgi:hypothetical protein
MLRILSRVAAIHSSPFCLSSSQQWFVRSMATVGDKFRVVVTRQLPDVAVEVNERSLSFLIMLPLTLCWQRLKAVPQIELDVFEHRDTAIPPEARAPKSSTGLRLHAD